VSVDGERPAIAASLVFRGTADALETSGERPRKSTRENRHVPMHGRLHRADFTGGRIALAMNAGAPSPPPHVRAGQPGNFGRSASSRFATTPAYRGR